MTGKENVEAYCRSLRHFLAGDGADPSDAETGAGDQRALVESLVKSAEFHAYAALTVVGDYYYDVPRIEVDMSEAQRAAMFDRLVSQWRALGEQDPFWSVLTHEEYRTVNLNEQILTTFYDSGADHARLIELFCARSKVDPPGGTCVELGCGVGRVTKHLASRFSKVIAVDISPGNLRQCQAMLDREQLKNVECRLLASPRQLLDLEPYDFLYSVIVLQHNQPPIQKFMLDVLLSKLRPGGGFLFQAQTYHPGYAFSVDAHLASALDPMDMHSLPMPEILGVVEKHGHRIREVMEDAWTGRFGSHTFFGLARPRPRGLFASLFK